MNIHGAITRIRKVASNRYQLIVRRVAAAMYPKDLAARKWFCERQVSGAVVGEWMKSVAPTFHIGWGCGNRDTRVKLYLATHHTSKASKLTRRIA